MFRIAFIGLYAVFAAVRIYYRSQTIGRESKEERSQIDGPRIFLSIAIVGFFATVFIYLLIPEWIFWAHINYSILIRWGGLVLGLLSIGLLFWTHHTLGRQFAAKLAIQHEHKLIEGGPYSRVRHPMYTIFSLFSLAVALISSNWFMLIFALLIAIPFHWISKTEEQMLIDQFGDEYVNYMNRTGRFLPQIRRKD